VAERDVGAIRELLARAASARGALGDR